MGWRRLHLNLLVASQTQQAQGAVRIAAVGPTRDRIIVVVVPRPFCCRGR